jgi:2,4-dienoyl-CoA reductase (NADPH2)
MLNPDAPTAMRVFQPIQLGQLELQNRIVMGSMHTGLEEAKGGFHALARFYAERAKGGAGLIVTGGISPNRRGVLKPGGAKLTSRRQIKNHQIITKAVHEHGGKICLQILHGGRYSYHPFNVAPSNLKAAINRFTPRSLSTRGVKKTIRQYTECAALAKEAGYDGIEIMGSEGYLINQFLVTATNKRTDIYGGSFEDRMQFPLEIVRHIREKVGPNFAIIFRLSMLDLVQDGSSWNEIKKLAQALETEGVDAINTGIGWHEARIPTIATLVPRGGFSFVTKKLMGCVNVPLITTNRFNTIEACETAVQEGCADMVSMARPFLADAEIVNKSKTNPEAVNTCIGCNQACLDHIFENKIATCLVNPRASHEELWPLEAKANSPKRVAVVGSGPAGLSAALESARLGHDVSLFEAAPEIGGQFNMAKKIPGKKEFYETLRYFDFMLKQYDVHVNLNTEANAAKLSEFEHVIIATGVKPRPWTIPGANTAEVVSYIDVLQGRVKVGKRVAIIGAGGIGFDVAEFLIHQETDNFFEEWGIDQTLTERGGLQKQMRNEPNHQVHLFQRSEGKVGGKLGKTTGWIHRLQLKNKNVITHKGVEYQYFKDGLLTFNEAGSQHQIPFDSIIVCAGQTSFAPLAEILTNHGKTIQQIGGALNAKKLDAQRAIREGLEAAYSISEWT